MPETAQFVWSWRSSKSQHVSGSAQLPFSKPESEAINTPRIWRWRSNSPVPILREDVVLVLRDLRAVGDRLSVGRNSGLVSVDHGWIPQDDCHRVLVVADRDCLPALVPLEFRECEAARHFDAVLVLIRPCDGTDERGRTHENGATGQRTDDLPNDGHDELLLTWC